MTFVGNLGRAILAIKKYAGIPLALMLVAAPAMAGHHDDDDDTAPSAAVVSASNATTGATALRHGFLATQFITRRFSPFSQPFTLPGAPAFAQFDDLGTGLAAGDGMKRGSGWVSGNYGSQRNTFPGTRSSGNTFSGGFGADWQLDEMLTVGLSITGSRTDQTTRFNDGSSKTNGLTLSPYIAGRLTDVLSYDLSLGYSWNRTEQDRRTAGVLVTGSSRSGGYVASGNLTAARWFGSFMLTGKAGFVASRSERSSFFESDGNFVQSSANNLFQGRFQVGAAYWLEPVMISASATYVNDFNRTDTRLPGAAVQPANDRDGVILEGGMTFYGSGATDGVTASLTASTEVGRKQQRNFNIGGNLRFAF